MAALLSTHYPIIPLQTTSGNTEQTVAYPEKASQTFLLGVPVQLNAGYVQKWDGTTYTNGILGISLIPASNLATNGAGAPAPFGQITGIGAIQSYGNVPNEPNAVNIAIGTPITDGRTLLALANSDTIFEIQTDASTGAVYTPTQAMVSSQYGITFDTNGSAYLDLGKSTPGTNTCAQIVGLSPVDGSIPNGRVRIVIVAPQLYA